MTRRTQICAIVLAGVALLALAVHQLICSSNGTMLRPTNILLDLSLIAVIMTACLYSLSKTRHITWKNVTVLVFALMMLIGFRLVMCIPKVVLALGFAKYMTIGVLYVLLQFAIGIAWFKMVKPKQVKDEPTSPDGIVQDELPSERE